MSATRTGRKTRASSQRTYDAFISYSHAADSRLAPSLERGLRRLTRAWYQRQALRIFRDQTTLAANPDLYATIERALQQSGNFILLASPAAARSPWVRREVRYWKEHRERETFFIALTDGVIRWSDTEGDFDWRATSALPDELRGWFPREPLWVNLGWTRGHDPSDLTLRHGRFRDDIATLAAALHGRSKDQIDSEDARQHRLAVRLGRVFVATLVMLLILAGVESNIANTQRNIAQHQTAVAQQQRALVTQRALEAEAEVDAATSPKASLNESLAALQVQPTAQVRQTLVNTLLHTRFQGSSQPQTPNGLADSAAFSPDGRLFADAAEQSGKTVVSLWRTTDPVHPALVGRLPSYGSKVPVTDVALSPDDRVLAVVAGGKAELWSTAPSPRLLTSFTLAKAQAVAFSPDGAALAVVGGQSAKSGSLEIWNIAAPATPRLLARVGGLYYPQHAAFSPDGRTLVTGSGEETIDSNGNAVERTRAILWDVASPQAPRQLTTILVWDGEGGIAFGPAGPTLALTWANKVSLWNIADPAHPHQLAVLLGDTSEIDAIAFSPDGRSLVTGGLQQHKILLWNTTDPAHVPHSTLLAQDAAPINALTFVRGGQSVLTADEDTQVSQWRVADSAPARAATVTDPAASTRPVLTTAVSPNSRVLAMGGWGQAVVLWGLTNPTHPAKLARIPSDAGNASAVAFSPDGTVLAVGAWNKKIALWDVSHPASPRLLGTASTPGVVSWLTFTPGGTTLAGGGDPPDSDTGMPDPFAPAWSDLWNVSDARHPVFLHQFTKVGNNDPGALSPDGKTLVLPAFFDGNLGQSQVQVWNIADPAHPIKLADPDNTNPLAAVSDSDLSEHLTFGPAKGLAATVSIGESPKTVLWSYNGHGAAKQLSAFTGPTDTVSALAFHPGGNLIAAASDDFTTTIGDIADTSQPFTVQTITGFTGTVNDTVFSPDGRLLVAAGNDGTVQIWTLGALPSVAANPVGLACQLTGGGYTRAQWNDEYASGLRYSSPCA